MSGDRRQRILEQYLLRRGLKLSRQRVLILEAMSNGKRPLELEEVLAKVRDRDPRVTRATVQRTLRTFSEVGVVEEDDGGYQLSAPEHGEGARYDHLVCTKCGTILDFDNQELAVLRRAVAAHHGFVVKHYTMVLFGSCAGCSAAGK